MKFKKLNFAEVTSQLATTIARNDELFKSFRKCLGLTSAQFEFYLNNVTGVRPFTDAPKEDKCHGCGSTMPQNERGDCPQCGL
jgi:hypothetical protein